MKSVSNIRRERQAGPRFPARPSASRLSKAVSAAALVLACTLTACGNDYTLGFVYAPSASLTSGLINAYGIDNQTGKLRLLNDSPIPSGGRNPVAVVATPGNQDFPAIFVIHRDDSNVVVFTVGTDGKLYPSHTYDTTGSFPTAVAISPDGKFLYVAYTYQRGFTTASPGPGGISVYAVGTDATRSLGIPTDFQIGRAPVAIAVGNGGKTVYVATQDGTAINPASTGVSDATLNLFAFAADGSGNLSALPGEQIVSGNVPSFGYATGAAPGGVIADPSGTHLYVTDSSGNVVIGYTTSASGIPVAIPNGSAATGKSPRSMTIDAQGSLLFVANYEGTVGEYTLGANGVPVASAAAASTETGAGTTCVTIEPTHGKYLYVSGSLSNTITGEEIVAGTGELKPIIASPYPATTLPLCTVSVPRFKLGS